MTDELGQLDLELKGLFMEAKFDELIQRLNQEPKSLVKEACDYNWNIVKKYYDTERFDLLLTHMKFVAYTCFMIEYAHKAGLLGDDVFGIMMMIYNDIYELKKAAITRGLKVSRHIHEPAKQPGILAVFLYTIIDKV